MKTPTVQRAAGRRKLASAGNALADGSFPIPDVDYLKRAIRSVGRAPASKRPALKALIRKRARELNALNAPGVKGTWPFASGKSMAADTEGIELAMAMRRMPVVRGTADVQASRTGPGAVSVMHKSTGLKIGTLVPAANGGYQGVHADGTKTPASGSMGGAMAGLIAYHNKVAAQRKMPSAQQDGTASYANGEQMSLDLAGALPHTTAASSSTDGPRVTMMGGAGKAKASKAGAPSATGVSAEIAKVYKKLLAKGMKPDAAMALAKRAAAMHAKASSRAA
jgi:hypothetical protein